MSLRDEVGTTLVLVTHDVEIAARASRQVHLDRGKIASDTGLSSPAGAPSMKWVLAMLRESRGSRGRLVFFTLCIAIGVAAVVGVATLAATIEDALRSQSRNLLAADLSVSSRRPLGPEIEKMLEAGGATEITHTREFGSMVRTLDAKEKPGPIETRPASRSCAATSRSTATSCSNHRCRSTRPSKTASPSHLSSASRLANGVRIGTKTLPVTAIVKSEPQELNFMSMFRPARFSYLSRPLAIAGCSGSAAACATRCSFAIPEGTRIRGRRWQTSQRACARTHPEPIISASTLGAKASRGYATRSRGWNNSSASSLFSPWY